jgi:hypothetical protein
VATLPALPTSGGNIFRTRSLDADHIASKREALNYYLAALLSAPVVGGGSGGKGKSNGASSSSSTVGSFSPSSSSPNFPSSSSSSSSPAIVSARASAASHSSAVCSFLAGSLHELAGHYFIAFNDALVQQAQLAVCQLCVAV